MCYMFSYQATYLEEEMTHCDIYRWMNDVAKMKKAPFFLSMTGSITQIIAVGYWLLPLHGRVQWVVLEFEAEPEMKECEPDRHWLGEGGDFYGSMNFTWMNRCFCWINPWTLISFI